MKQRLSALILVLLSYASASWAQVRLVADGQTDTYALINSVLAPGANAIEQPDCLHPDFGPHITQAHDADLAKPVFVFHMHAVVDGDGAAAGGCQRVDRQRNEIKTYGPSPAYVKAFFGETVTYRWRFKLDAAFQPSPNFTHIHQIKAGDGTNDDAPIFTLTPRLATPERLELIWINSAAVTTRVQTAPLADFKGEWIEAYETITFTDPGRYKVELRRIRDGATLLSYANDSIETWRTGGTTFVRPKWGIYRSLTTIAALRDEQVRFDNFCLAKGADDCPSGLPDPIPTPVPTPTPRTLVFEAESLARTTSGPSGSNQVDPLASGGAWVAFTARMPGDWIEYTLPAIPRGVYELTFRYKTNPNRGIHNVALDGTGRGSDIDQFKTGTAAYPDVALGSVRFETDGPHFVRLTSVGKRPEAGNHAISADRFVFVADARPPVLTPPVDMTVEATGPDGAAVTFSASAVDDADGVVPVTFAPEPGSVFPLGATTVTATATDLTGNSASAAFTVSVVDTTPPVLTLPEPLTAEATGPTGAAVTWTATAHDVVSAGVPVTFSAAPGTTFPIGTTAVTATAADAFGNVATGTFTVTVRDTTAPAFVKITATPRRILRDDHRLVLVRIHARVADAADSVPVTRIVAVRSNEPEDGACDGHTRPDFKIVGPLAVKVRAERSCRGSGRIYTIAVESRDASGNARTRTVEVVVPKRRGGHHRD